MPATQAVSVDIGVDTTLVVNEVLCYTFANFAKVTANQLKSTLASFYKDVDLLQAKELLINNVDAVTENVLKRYAKRKGDNKGRLIVDDIFDIMSIVDENRLVEKLPRFVAVDLEKIPTVRIEDVDVFNMARKLEAIEAKMISMEKMFREVTSEHLSHLSARAVESSNAAPVNTAAVNTRRSTRLRHTWLRLTLLLRW